MQRGTLSVDLHQVLVLSAPEVAPLWPVVLGQCLREPGKDCGCSSEARPRKRKAKLPMEKPECFSLKMMKWTHSAGTGEIFVIILIFVASRGRSNVSTYRPLQLYIFILKKCMKHNKTGHMQLRPVSNQDIVNL